MCGLRLETFLWYCQLYGLIFKCGAITLSLCANISAFVVDVFITWAEVFLCCMWNDFWKLKKIYFMKRTLECECWNSNTFLEDKTIAFLNLKSSKTAMLYIENGTRYSHKVLFDAARVTGVTSGRWEEESRELSRPLCVTIGRVTLFFCNG